MKIYTRTGDSGETSLISGQRVAKSDARIEAYGTVDELNACLGLIRDSASDKCAETDLQAIQNNLFALGSQLAAGEKNRFPLPELAPHSTKNLENAMDKMNEELPELRNFILPGGDLSASYCHLARTVCRRAERRVVELRSASSISDEIVHYLNRLSDYLFTLARFYTHRHSGKETIWKSVK